MISFKNIYHRVIILLLLCSFVFTACINKDPLSFWDNPQQGANIFNKDILRKDIQAAKSYGINFVRLAPDKFASASQDFLIGSADHYQGLVLEDMLKLRTLLDVFAQEDMPVVLTMLSLPGSRWKQHNDGQDDLRLWRDKNYQEQSAQFWQDLAKELASHPAIIGFNILNEPHLERLYEQEGLPLYQTKQEKVQQILFEFYALVIRAIRSIHTDIPIILDSSAYGDPKTFEKIKVHEDPKILYSFHMYEPYTYTNRRLNNNQFQYPGLIKDVFWDKNTLENYMHAVTEFQEINQIPSHRILVGEFGGHRMSKGLSQYFQDLTSIFRAKQWHYAFYAFREDTWDGMDYELGTQRLPQSYWETQKEGQTPIAHRDLDSPLLSAILDPLS